jgi:hypothetical protein
MRLADIEEVRQTLRLLAGKQMSRVKSAGNMKLFGFGMFREADAEHTEPEFDLHVMCPWRIEDTANQRIVTGFFDFYVPATKNQDPSWEPSTGTGSLQNERIHELLHGPGSPLTSNVNTFGELMVTQITLLPCFGLQIDLSPFYRLTVFPCGSTDEQWRFVIPGTPSTHYVLESTSLWVE